MTSPALVGTVLDGKFQIEKELASGPGGDVYEAVHLGLGSRVAVKVLRPGIPETADIRRKRFMREARVAARIKSDHVVRVFDIVAPERGITYIVMELLDGETLLERFRRVGAMPAEQAVGYVLQAAKPLAELHDAGIVHRDVKPSNIFITRTEDGHERVKLLDFGVAAFQQPLTRGESSITLSEAIVGTPRYMAPEQVVAASRVDARTDVWALGVTLYELLAGAPPFRGATVLAVLNQIERQEPKPLSVLAPNVPRALAALVHRCLEKDPALRPADARALAAALGAPEDAAPAPTSQAPLEPVRPRAVSMTNVEGASPVQGATTLDAAPPSAPVTHRRRTATILVALAATVVVVVAAFASRRIGASAAPAAASADPPIASATTPTPIASSVSDPVAPSASARAATALRSVDPPRALVVPARIKPAPRKVSRPPADDDRIE